MNYSGEVAQEMTSLPINGPGNQSGEKVIEME